jgi:hypothetical protein
MWRIFAPILLLAAILTWVVASAAQPADGAADSTGTDDPDSSYADAGEADSSLVDSGDSLAVGMGDDDAAGGGRGRGKRRGNRDSLAWYPQDNWLGDTHPKYEITISKELDVTKWNSKISMQRKLSDKLDLNLNATLNTKENQSLNRSESNDGTTANLNYKLNEDITLGLVYNSTVLANRYSIKHSEPDDRRKKEDTRVSAAFSKQVSDAIALDFKTLAGSTENSYADVRNKGSRANLIGSVTFDPNERFNTKVGFNAERLNLDSAVDSAEVDIFKSKDETQRQRLTVSAGYTLIPGLNLGFNAGRSDETRQHPEPKQRIQETEKHSSRNLGISSSFNMVPWFTWDMDVGFDDSERRYTVAPQKDNISENSSLSGNAKILPWRGAALNLGGERKESFSSYQGSDGETDVQRSLSLKLTQGLGSKADLSVTALSDLLSIFFVDKAANPKDRDRLKNRVTLDLNFTAFKRISTKLGLQYGEEQTIYVLKEASADNRTTRRYRLSGRYSFTTFRKIDVMQDYDISSVYTYYHFTDDEFGRNTLVRNSNVQTRLVFPIIRSLKLNFGHTYKFQDQGRYSEKGGKRTYSRASETEAHRINLGLNYKFINAIKIFIRQSYYVQQKWSLTGGKKELESQTVSSEIMGRVVFNYNLGDRTKVSLRLEQNLKEGERVNQAYRSYRNIEFEASHVF